MKFLTFISLLFICPSIAHSAEKWLCTAEAAGGVLHQNGEWEGKGFNTNSIYVIAPPTNPMDKTPYVVTKLGSEISELRCDQVNSGEGLVCTGWADFRFGGKSDPTFMSIKKDPTFTSIFKKLNNPHDHIKLISVRIEIGSCEPF